MNNSQNTKRKIDEQELFEDSILEGLEPNTKRKKQVYDLRGKEYIFIGKDKVHKPDKKKSNSVLQQSSDSSTSCLGEKQLMVCKTCRKLSFDLKEKNSKDLVAELRSKTFKTDLNGIDDFTFRCGYRFCCDELERLLKVKK